MRVRFAPALVLIATLPALLFAQRGGGGSRGGGNQGPDKYGPRNDMPKYPAAAELQKYNPVVYLIDRRKKLALTDSQVAVLRVLQGKIYERNGDLLAAYDDVQRIYKPENANDASSLRGDSTRTRALQQTRIMNNVLDSLMSRRQDDDLEALALIADDKQKQAAAEMLDKQDSDFAKLIPAGAPRGGRRRPT